MSEWQPIETAPKDSSRFIATNRNGRAFICYWGHSPALGSYWFDDCGQCRDPGLWMPLPEPPK